MKHEIINSSPLIHADRFVLRPARRSDAGLWALYAGDARVASNTTSIPHPLPPGAEEAFVTMAQSPERCEDTWVMDGSANGLGEFLGVISLKRLTCEKAEISYWVAPALWNAGYASEAVEALIAANPHKLDTIFASVFQSNQTSARVLIKAGFDYIGDAEAYCVAQSRMVPTWTYLKKLKVS
ncbi:MAG: GNAT family N-acetyltransferase [Mangrovicoccus sp.]